MIRALVNGSFQPEPQHRSLKQFDPAVVDGKRAVQYSEVRQRRKHKMTSGHRQTRPRRAIKRAYAVDARQVTCADTPQWNYELFDHIPTADRSTVHSSTELLEVDTMHNP